MTVRLGVEDITVEQIVRSAMNGEEVAVSHSARNAIERAHQEAETVSSRMPVYGRSTGVGANRSVSVAGDDEHGMRLLRSHAVDAGDPLPPAVTRAMLAVRLSQLCRPGSGIRPDILDGLVRMLNEDALPEVLSFGAIGTADVSALAGTALVLTGERPASRPFAPLPHFCADSALPFISSSALTIGRAALMAARLDQLDRASHVVFGFIAHTLNGNSQHWSDAAAKASSSPGAGAVAARIRDLFEGSPQARSTRIQDPYGIRAYTIVQGLLADSVRTLRTRIESLANIAQENPLYVLDEGEGRAVHHAGFFQASLAQSIDMLNISLSNTVPLSVGRLRMLHEPHVAGAPLFLASDVPGSSGLMMIEYVAASAGAEMRASSNPASTGTAVLSRGMEEDATFASQAVVQLERSVDAYSIVLASELLAATRALRTFRTDETLPPRLAKAALLLDGLPNTNEDRDLRPDLELCRSLLPTLALEAGAADRDGRNLTTC